MSQNRDRLSKISQRDRRAIEQAIARGASNKALMEAWGLSYQTLADLKDEMLTGRPRDGKAGPKQVVIDVDITRPVESYYGPAAPEVIEHLIGEMFGEHDRRKARRGAAA